MKKQFKLGVIGCNSSAVTVLRGAVLSDFIREKKIIVGDTDETRLDEVAYLGVRTASDIRFVAENSEYLLISAHKDYQKTAKLLEGVNPEKVISIMPGVTKREIKNSLGTGVIKVARCVMNLPCTVGSGLTAIDMTDYNKSSDDCDFISNLFNSLGSIISFDESKLDAVSAVSGNCVYFLLLTDALIEAGVKSGLTKNEAQTIAVQSVSGISDMLARGEDNTVDSLVMQCCKENKQAISAVKVLQDGDFKKLISEAVNDALGRK